MVMVDKLTKGDHFVLVKITPEIVNIEKIYMMEMARLHGIRKEIVSNF